VCRTSGNKRAAARSMKCFMTGLENGVLLSTNLANLYNSRGDVNKPLEINSAVNENIKNKVLHWSLVGKMLRCRRGDAVTARGQTTAVGGIDFLRMELP